MSLAICLDQLTWTSRAACRGHDTDLWFAEERVGTYREARVICCTCLVRAECLQWALDTRTDHGLFGGLSPLERKRLRGWRVP